MSWYRSKCSVVEPVLVFVLISSMLDIGLWNLCCGIRECEKLEGPR